MSCSIPGMKSINYYFDDRHELLNKPVDVVSSNIGINGCNLTISFLSLNRVSLSIKLLDSIKQHLVDFSGEILIADNGSNPSELSHLKKYLENYSYRWRLLEFDKNFGVAGGRNRSFAKVGTDWVMCLDNDIYFTKNSLPQIQKEIALLGCHFMSLPLVNPDHETLYAHGACLKSTVKNGQAYLSHSSFFSEIPMENAPNEVFLSTYLFGGASILKVATFMRLGGYDDNMLIGFEDTDFSLTLFREGYKIGTTSEQFLVHDHPRAENETDADYEKTRYSRQILQESGTYLERKTGYKIWDDEIDDWLKFSKDKQGEDIDDDKYKTTNQPDSNKINKARIALILGKDNRSFNNIARQLKNHLSDRFEFEIIFVESALDEVGANRPNGIGQFNGVGLALLATEDFDIVHFLWRDHLSYIDTPLLENYARHIGMDYPQFKKRFIDGKIISTAVHDHLFLEASEIEKYRHVYNDIISGYYVGSNRLKTIYENIENYRKPDAVLSVGVDPNVFKPANIDRFETIASRNINIGWVSNNILEDYQENFKKNGNILTPVIEQLQSEGLAIKAKTTDSAYGSIPYADMPDYYAGIDVFICTSNVEETASFVLEAMACGVPVISTNVGIVPDVFGEMQMPFMLKKRSVDCLKDALHKLIMQPELFAKLSDENLQSIKEWECGKQAEKFALYFDNLLAEKQTAKR